MKECILFTTLNSPRATYIFDFIFYQQLGLQWETCSDEKAFLASEKFRINYSESFIEGSMLQIVPHGLLAQHDTRQQDICMGAWTGLPSFFATKGDIPFDLFSASFYLLSRYEEYLPYTPDEFQRFPSSLSLAVREGFIKRPLIDLWVMEMKKVMKEKMPALVFMQHHTRFIPTYDIDIAYSIRGKGMLRFWGACFRELFSGDLGLLATRIRVGLGMETDPYDAYTFLDSLHKHYKVEPLYFFLVGDGSELDKNLPFNKTVMQGLFKRVASGYSTGVHPSYKSHDAISELKKEIEAVGSKRSRQHYIRFALPVTFEQLLKCGIRDEYSMGYGSINGFRASTSFPHKWFNVQAGLISELQLHPFCFMEANSFFEQQDTAEQALDEMRYLYQQVESTGAPFISIWHNFSLGTDPMWRGWKEAYTSFIAWVSEREGRC